MKEVTKLYENAGCELVGCCKYAEYGYEGEEGTWYYCKKEGKECWTYPKGDADCVEKAYPLFTAEKQLEIFKMFCGRYLEVSQHAEENGDLCFGIKATVGDFAVGFNKDFAECLASFVNCLWQSLTEEERKRIKEILE